eukprot:14312444-Ditylum_brightwellii.AAC.1
MKDTIRLLHEEWHGIVNIYIQDHPDNKGISKSIRDLDIDNSNKSEDISVPIDNLAINITSGGDDNNENWGEEGLISDHV